MKPLTKIESYPDLARAIGLGNVYFKREDMHPYGSHKGRSIPVMIDHYYKSGDKQFAISSSGNAALAASMHIEKLADATLDIFVGTHISKDKLQKIREVASRSDERIKIFTKERPLQALSDAMDQGKRSLRQSTDDLALVGYESLARELIEDPSSIRAVFIGTSSGTTAQALASYFLDKKADIQVHIIQTSSCHPISDAFENFSVPDERSLADAIVDRTALRKDRLVDLIRKTGGRGWCATNEDIENAMRLAKEKTGVKLSTNSALSVVGAMQAGYISYEIAGPVVCMICGE